MGRRGFGQERDQLECSDGNSSLEELQGDDVVSVAIVRLAHEVEQGRELELEIPRCLLPHEPVDLEAVEERIALGMPLRVELDLLEGAQQ